MRAGVWIVNVFAAIWGLTGLAALGVARWWWIVPVATSAAMVAIQLRGVGRRPARSPEQAQRATLLWTGAEVVLILISVNVLPNLGYAGMVVPRSG